MESLEESTSSQVEEKSDENKNDNSLKENGVQEPLPKKKFANTNFALKMKNKKREEKLNNIDAKEALSTCKQVSIDVTRLTSNPVPKVMNAVENKSRKKKRSQWKLGIAKPKKKPLKKDVKESPLNKGLVNGVGESNHVGEDIESTEKSKVETEEPIEPNSEKKKQAADKESTQRRKSLRSVTSSTSESIACESENKVQEAGPAEEDIFSCRRTEPFIGKLITKEARDEIVNRILKGETEPKAGCSNETKEKEVPLESKESKAEDVNKSLAESNEKTEANDKVEKEVEKSPKPTVMDTDEQVVNQPLRRSTSKIAEAKESDEFEEVRCSRTMPFVGKTIRKLPVDVPERPIELDCQANQNNEKSVPKDDTINMDASAASENETLDSPKDINANAESTLGIKILSVSSLKDDDGTKADFLPEKADEPVIQPTLTPSKDTNIDSDSQNKVQAKEKSKLAIAGKSETSTKNGEQQSDSSLGTVDTKKNKRRPSSSVERRSSLRSNVSVKSDSISEDFDSKSTSTTVSTLEDYPDPWSCQRVMPFRGKTRSQPKRQSAAENTSNQMETSSTAPTNSSVSSNDLLAPAESVSQEGKQIDNVASQNEISNDVISKDNENAESAAEPLDNKDARSATNSPVLNGEWKFRRKRQILSSDDESQDKEVQKTKKTKVKSASSDTKTRVDKKSATQNPSPGKTICSFLSSTCTKHDHHSPSVPCSAPTNVRSEACVLLTRLEDMNDPEVKGYLSKTELVGKIKKNYRRIMVDNDTSDITKTKPDRERSISTSTQATKEDFVPTSVPETIQESDSSASFKPSQVTEDTSCQSTGTSTSRSRRRTMSSRASSESPILQTKRKKRPVNYLEDFSDSETDNASSARRLRSQNEGSMSRDRAKSSGAQGNTEGDENDMEVEEFSRVGRHNRTENSNQEDSEQDCSRTQGMDEFKKARARCKSVVERKSLNAQKCPTRSKTPQVGMATEKSVKMLHASEIDKKKLEEDLVQGFKSMEESLNKELAKRGLIPPGTIQIANKKTPTLIRQISSEPSCSTPIVAAAKPMTPRKILGTPSQSDIASPRSAGSLTPRRSMNFQRNELLSKVTKSALHLSEANGKKGIKDVRVQLVKLEAVCSDYKDYSAGEIELLTSKYIDMLMNSNFACDTWRGNPIKLATLYSRSVELHGDEGEFDLESQDNEPLPFEEVQVPMDSADIDFDLPSAEQNTANERLRSPKKSNKQPTELESAIASLSQKTGSQEKTFGAINISEVLSQPVADEEDTENNRTVDSVVEDDANELDDSVGLPKDPSTIAMNGAEVHTCTSCNRVFMEKELLQKHMNKEHPTGENSSTSTAISSRCTTKQAPGPASSKKAKKKYKVNDSLKCTICLETFGTKELLFDHIMTHNEQDLQEAYKAAKLAILRKSGDTTEDLPAEEEEANGKKQKKQPNHRKSTDSVSTIVSGEELTVDSVRIVATSLTDAIAQQNASSNAIVTAQSKSGPLSNKTLAVCQCHAHELVTEDLHIEMVLLCTACNVIYRRRDCFEVHFRNSVECRRKRANSEVTKTPKLFCSGCRRILNSLMEMRAHLEEHAKKNGAGTVTFLCNICKVAFFGVGGIFYSHWFNHAKSPDFVASRYSFPKLSVVSVLEDINGTMTTSKSQEGFFYIAEHVCRECRLPFSSDPELQKHKQQPCQPPQPEVARVENPDNNRLQMIKLICDLCKKFYVSKDTFDKHCNDRNHLKTPITKFSRLPINATEQVFVCSLCRAYCKTLDEMKEHWKRLHSPIMELYTCKTCNIVPSSDAANYTYEKFERHCQLVHKSEVITCLVYFVTARYVCSLCKFGFENEKSLKDHELAHQKKTAIQNSPSLTAPTSMPTQTSTFFVADNIQPDGGRRLHPVVMQYPNVNGPATVGQLPSQPQLQLPNQNNSTVTSNQIFVPTTSAMRMQNNPSENVNSELHSVLKTVLQSNPSQQNTVTVPQEKQQSKVVETIELDSRSNSPVLDSPAPSTSGNSNSLAAAKKAYMTKVNPNFETILTTTGNQENRNSIGTPNLNKSQPSRSENATPAEVDTLTPQPFEVVLVTDELSENSDQDKNDNLESTSSNEQPQQPAPEIIETKSFLRVRSVAELQSIKIQLCSICGMNFDTPYALEQHEKQHRSMGDVGRSTPVQMISPMVAPGSKEPTHEPHSMLMSQMKQKLSLNTSNGPTRAPTSSTNVNTRVMPSVLPHQPVLPPQQQQSWYPTSSNTSATMSNANYATNQSHAPPAQNHSVLRQAINSAPMRTGYTTVRPPPPYPGSSNSMVASNRPSAIQLPERSTTGIIPPQTKRPSGAATRIPQQSLQSFDDMNNRQSGNTVTYNTAPQQSLLQKSYGTVQSTVNYSSVNSPVNYQSVPQPQPRQQQPQKNVIYTCKHPNCFYRSASLAGIRAHETIHLLSQQGPQSQQMPTTSSNHQQQQHQQQQPPRLLPVSQMPERTRHAVPSSRPPAVSSNQDKRITCRICNLNCATSIELIEHVSTVHSGANQVCCYVCDYCPSPLIFDTEDQLRKHMNHSHNHSCNVCNKRYPSKEDLLLHMEVHMRRP